jgi:hypothetical protein
MRKLPPRTLVGFVPVYTYRENLHNSPEVICGGCLDPIKNVAGPLTTALCLACAAECVDLQIQCVDLAEELDPENNNKEQQ